MIIKAAGHAQRKIFRPHIPAPPVKLPLTSIAFVLLALALLAPRASAQGVRPRPPEDITLSTKDGVQIKITYYASSAGAEAATVVMLHDFNETRAVFEPLALALQNPPRPAEGVTPMASRAVITVDLRGHGRSKTAFGPGGASVGLDVEHFGPQDFQYMVHQDMEAVRAFLVERNDARELNLNRTCVLGSGMGANVALLWAFRDWATPPLPVRKQGQDVQALVLLSPRWNYRGLALVEAMKFPPIQQELSVFLAYGARDPKVAKDCENIRKTFERYHPEPPRDRALALKDFFVFAPETRLQGTELLTSREFDLAPKIVSFIEARLGRIDFPYVPRKK
jgi:pimeloyl-ACP methyl ester carboxylesterase